MLNFQIVSSTKPHSLGILILYEFSNFASPNLLRREPINNSKFAFFNIGCYVNTSSYYVNYIGSIGISIVAEFKQNIRKIVLNLISLFTQHT
jgi:hypothetical protein